MSACQMNCGVLDDLREQLATERKAREELLTALMIEKQKVSAYPLYRTTKFTFDDSWKEGALNELREVISSGTEETLEFMKKVVGWVQDKEEWLKEYDLVLRRAKRAEVELEALRK